MEEIFDLQLFAEGEGGTAAVGDGTGDSNAPNSPPQKRYRAAKGSEDNTRMTSELAGGTAARAARGSEDDTRGSSEFDTDGTADSIAPNSPPQKRYRAARGSEDNAGSSSELAGGPAAAIQNHFRHLEAEAEQMREVFPGFDLRRELRDPRFAALTAPGMGVSVEDAYYALHRQELQAASMQVAAQRAAQKLAFSIQSAARRPVENGAGSGAPAGLGPQAMTPKQREQLRQRIHNAAALGEKIFP